ncbi:hypothetical protein IQ268_14815 [Oculatella sp. LEGE 06141]|uniref:hypothetical protein n=1 Tax=Oculatella sp. LEGE 06141 TaxID=1828648 RepID=UPI0018821160|nr:hypothetical protein [Oculatella sp. LEGE 06141]MBE9179840.1 hypothetical protein [Oculatella sp. LEGE 06141]
MAKGVSIALGTTVWLIAPADLSGLLAQTCATNCVAQQIQFTPGQPIRLEMVNHTSSLVQVEQIVRTNPIPLLPGQALEIDSSFGTAPNTSVVFWDETALSIRAQLVRPNERTLRIEIFPGGQPPGDRSVYIQNDGKVAVF